MKSELVVELENLKEMLNNSKEFKELEEVDEEIQKDVSFKVLASTVKQYSEEYHRFEKVLKFDDPNLVSLRRRYSNAKESLDNHPLYKKYLEKYKVVRDMYKYINDELFGEIIDKKFNIWLELLVAKIDQGSY